MDSFNKHMNAFFTLHRNIPREGPGSDASTRAAIRRLRPLPPSPTVLDLGCGPGRQTLVLARELGVPIAALDFHAPYLARLRQAADEQGLSDLIHTRCADMRSLRDPPGSVDLIWAEGSIFIFGFFQGLCTWHTLLKPGGQLVTSEVTWLTNNPPLAAKAFWHEECPTMTTIEGNIASATDAGYQVYDHFTLPRSDWWDEYLTPLRQRVARLRSTAETNVALEQVLDETEREIAICDDFGDDFGYVFYLMQKVG
jgi:cyclopropane fatty-acyl-phospholipid synthase-like methyltransferase